jgi:GNAT superfamily N-acetyltransferase
MDIVMGMDKPANNYESSNWIFDYPRIVFRFVQHHRWSELFRRIWNRATKWLYDSKNMYIMRADSEAAIDPSLEIKELTLSDIDRMLGVMYLSRADICKRFSRGDRCFAAMNDSEIAAYCWVRFGVWHLVELYLEVKLEPNRALFYNAVTVKSARGRGYYPNLIRYMAKAMKAEGFNCCFTFAEERNRPSVRGLMKSCKALMKIRMRKLFSKTRYDVTVFDKNAWEQFSDVIKNPHSLKNSEEGKPCL